MKIYIGVNSQETPCSGLYNSESECKKIMNIATHGGVNDGRIKIVELMTIDEISSRDDICDEFIEEAKKVYFDNPTVIRCVELLSKEIKKRG